MDNHQPAFSLIFTFFLNYTQSLIVFSFRLFTSHLFSLIRASIFPFLIIINLKYFSFHFLSGFFEFFFPFFSLLTNFISLFIFQSFTILFSHMNNNMKNPQHCFDKIFPILGHQRAHVSHRVTIKFIFHTKSATKSNWNQTYQ